MFDLGSRVVKERAHLGISFDGDGDRFGCVDNMGDFIAPDIFCSLFAQDILKNNSNKKILCDVKCSNSLKWAIENAGGEVMETRTGASWTMSYVKDYNLPFGIEYSGHIYFNDRFFSASSGIYASLRMLEILSKTKESISSLLDKIKKYYRTLEMRVPCPDEKKTKIMELVEDYAQKREYKYSKIDGIKVLFPDAWALVRASNTGPNLTMSFEANNEDDLANLKEEWTILVNLFLKKF